jgi:glycosyltransferase involved in cell wall biosynthesis
MKLLILSIEFPPGPGGLGTTAYQAALQLSRLGWQVCVATPQHFAGEQEIQRFNAGLPFALIRFRYEGAFLFEAFDRFRLVWRCLREWRPDLILAVGRQAAWLGDGCSRLARIPLAVFGAGTEFLVKARLDQALTRRAFDNANLVIAISMYARNLAESNGFKTSHFQVIPLGADESLFAPAPPSVDLRKRLDFGKARILLTVGQVSERKAQDVVIRALPRILEECPGVVYLVAGLPTLQVELRRLAESLGVAQNVRFAGKVPQAELPAFYNLADIFVLVSRTTSKGDAEGFGIVAVEAALCGKPSVVSDKSGLVEAVQPGETALVVPQNDPGSTAAAILHLLKDDTLRREMGQAARQNALEYGTWQKRMAQVSEALGTLLGEAHP